MNHPDHSSSPCLIQKSLTLEEDLFLSGPADRSEGIEEFRNQARIAQSLCILGETGLAASHYRQLAGRAGLGGFPGLALAARANEALVMALGKLPTETETDPLKTPEGLAEAYGMLFSLLEEARSRGIPGLEARILAKLGVVASRAGWRGEAETWLRQAIQSEREDRRDGFAAEARLYLAQNLLSQDRLAEAEMEARAVYEYASGAEDRELLAPAALVRARVFEVLAHWREAATAYRECLELERANSKELFLSISRDLGREALPCPGEKTLGASA